MKPSLPLSVALWATTGTALAQQLVPMAGPPDATPELVPMQSMSSSSAAQPVLTAMAETSPTISPTALVPMETKPVIQPVLTAMILAAPDSDTTLTPLDRPGKPEVMHGRTEKRISSPVPGLSALTPPLRVTPTNQKPYILKLLGAKPQRTIAASNSGTGFGFGASGTAVIIPNQLTDAELSPNPNIPTVTRAEDQAIAVDVTLNGIPRSTLLEVYQDDQNTLWFPLTPLAQLLEIPLNVNAAAGVAQGWYQSPDNLILINMAAGKTTIGKQTFPTGHDIEKHAADLYITGAALKSWFGVESKLDYNELRLKLTTPRPLPGDLHASRIATWDKTEKNRQRQAVPSDTLIPPYSNFSMPVLRLGETTQYTRPATGDAALATGLTLQSQNDMFGMNSNITLALSHQDGGIQSSTSNGLTGGSVLLQKQSDNADLLGNLHARYFGLGDINTNAIPLSGIATHGRGATVNDLPAGAVSNPDQYILTGPAPINWDAEVYQDATLVAFSRIDNSGTYRFTALPLKAGRNNFRIVLYGPNGEHEERRQTIYLADNIPTPGEVQYDASVFQQNRALIPGLPNQTSSTAITAQTQFIAGLTKNWAATIGAFQSVGSTSLSSDTRPEEKGISTGLRGSMGGSYFTADALTAGHGNAFQSTLRMPLTEDVDLRLAETRNLGFNSQERDDLTTSQAELTVPLSIGRARLDTAYGYTHTTYQTQQPRQDYTQRTSVGIGPINATNQLQVTSQNNSRQINGNLDAASHVFNTTWRAGLTYQPESTDVMRSYYINTQLPVTHDQTVNLTYTQQLADSHLSTLAGSMYWNTGPLALGLQGQAGSNGSAQVGLNLTTALVPQGYQQAKWKLSAPNATIGQGQAAVRVYGDENNNNQYDPGEPLLPNVTVYNRLRGSQQVTNAKGLATFTDLNPGALNRLDLDLTSLPDIYLKPVSETLNVKPHVGDNGILNYAVKLYGEISGQALTPSGQPIQNLTITLRDAVGTKVDTAITEHDGFFTFGALPMGTYNLIPAISPTTPVSVSISAKTRIKVQNITADPHE